MQAMQSQVQAVTEELGALKAEIVNLKASHAGLHQSAVDSNAQTNRVIGDIAGKLEAIQAKAAEIPNMAGGKKVTLMEPKQVTVEEFSGGIAAVGEAAGQRGDGCACCAGREGEILTIAYPTMARNRNRQ